MRIEPVYLLAPVPERPLRPSRRSLLCAILGAFAIGTASGFGLGRSLLPAAEPSQDSESSDRLDWALSLQADDIRTLVADHEQFLLVYLETHDPRLRNGIRRLVDEALATVEIAPDTARSLASKLAPTLEADPDLGDLRAVVPALKRIGR